MIALSAVLAGYEAIRRLLDPAPLQHLGWVAAAGVIGFLGNEWVALYRVREQRGQREDPQRTIDARSAARRAHEDGVAELDVQSRRNLLGYDDPVLNIFEVAKRTADEVFVDLHNAVFNARIDAAQ